MELTKRDFGVSILKKFGFLVGTSLPCRKKIPAPRKGLESSAVFLHWRFAPLIFIFLFLAFCQPHGDSNQRQDKANRQNDNGDGFLLLPQGEQ